jgi:predicted RNA binding protein YcfA (HicA-like mRNA interferase family)
MVDTREQEMMEDRDSLENEVENDGWFELRLQGKLPERRSNHCSFIMNNDGRQYLYIHGGRDLKEGAHSSMWRLDLGEVEKL